jgi:nitrogen fixation/metabolism regulation signal transduction histidine kinase
MINRKYYIQIIVRIILLLITCLGFAFLFSLTDKWFSILGLFILIVLQTLGILHYFNKYNIEIINFLASLKDFDTNIPVENVASFSKSPFKKYFIEMQNQFFQLKSQEIKQNIYLKNILNNMNGGFLEINNNGKIKFINNYAQNLLNLSINESLKNLKTEIVPFYNSINNIKPGQSKVIQINIDNNILKLSINALRYKTEESNSKMVFFQNITRELDENEIESWQKLIRVLSHEINNSVSPMTSLADSLTEYLYSDISKKTVKKVTELDQNSVNTLLEGINIIKERGYGLNNFIHQYRELIPKRPVEITNINIEETFYKIRILHSELLKQSNIQVKTEIQEKFNLTADQSYLEQILINLIKNAIESFNDIEQTNKTILLKAFLNNQSENIISIEDNGIGISDELLKKVQIPFYTTKENGSGIGLNLVRQIMHMHKGSMKIYSKENEGTRVMLCF